jgi:hypothetical protein
VAVRITLDNRGTVRSEWLGATWPNHGLPRGTPGLANEGYVKKFLGPGDSNPGPPLRQRLNKFRLPMRHRMVLVIWANLNYFKVNVCCWRGVGPGLSPDPGSIIPRIVHM